MLGICYGLQIMAYQLGGKVVPSKHREYGFANIKALRNTGLLSGIKDRG
jgi:GMP synthase (glutamine-hydrolysing)